MLLKLFFLFFDLLFPGQSKHNLQNVAYESRINLLRKRSSIPESWVYSSIEYGRELVCSLWGAGYSNPRLSVLSAIHFKINNPSSGHYNYTTVHARLVGPSIVDIPMWKNASHDIFTGLYLVLDPGEYLLQIRISWLEGSNLTEFLPLKHSKNGAVFLNRSVYLDEIIFNNSIVFVEAPDLEDSKLPRASNSISLLPLCSHGDGKGRWVRIASSDDCPLNICKGDRDSLSWLRDIYGFNDGWIWAPWNCQFQIFNITDVDKCFAEKNIENLALTGDSLVREHFQNLVTLLAPGAVQLQKIRSKGAVNIVLPSGRKVHIAYHAFPSDWGNLNEMQNFDVHLWNFPLLKSLVTETPEQELSTRASDYLLHVSNHMQKIIRRKEFLRITMKMHPQHYANSTGGMQHGQQPYLKQQLMHYLMHPKIQREDPRVNRPYIRSHPDTDVNSFACMTPLRQELVMREVLQNHLRDMKIPIIDGFGVSAARWESTWDGMHYSLMTSDEEMSPNASCKGEFLRGGRHLCHLRSFPAVNHCSTDGTMHWCRTVLDRNAKFNHFEGGVSRMLTMIWLNTICNNKNSSSHKK